MSKLIKNDEIRWSALMISAQQGNQQDYQQLLRELGEAIAAYLYTQFGDIELLEDCVQESLTAVHKARNTYEADRLFRPWLFAIVRHKAIDVLRKKESHRKLLDVSSELLSPTSQPDTNLSEQQMDCGKLLAALSEQHREAIVLTKLHGLTLREAAEELQISESAMKLRVHRALDASRQLLEIET